MKHIKKLVTITLIIVLCVLIYYRYANKDSSRDINKVENDSLSEVERVLTEDPAGSGKIFYQNPEMLLQ